MMQVVLTLADWGCKESRRRRTVVVVVGVVVADPRNRQEDSKSPSRSPQERYSMILVYLLLHCAALLFQSEFRSKPSQRHSQRRPKIQESPFQIGSHGAAQISQHAQRACLCTRHYPGDLVEGCKGDCT